MLAANVINIDRMIVKNRLPNLGYDIDYNYIARLSDDAWEIWPWLLDKADEKTANLVPGEASEWKWVYVEMGMKLDRLEKLKANNWGKWAGWNGTSVKAAETIEKLKERIEKKRRTFF